MADDWEQRAEILAAAAVAADRPTEWFNELYSAGRRGEVDMPWDRGRPNQVLAEWLRDRPGAGLRALVVGCGLGQESELLGRLGYQVTAFDIAESAIATVLAAAACIAFLRGVRVEAPAATAVKPPSTAHAELVP